MWNILLISAVLVSGSVTVSADKTRAKTEKREEIWEGDFSDSFKIDASTQGLAKVNLKCGANSMLVELQTEEPFHGIMYTRGSFYKQAEPCFVKNTSHNNKPMTMKFSLDQCQTIKDGDVYSNVVVVQHDPDLVTPGDSAFALECDFRKPRSLNVGANFQARERSVSGSRIILVSPDPSAPLPERTKQNTRESDTDSVEFIPNELETDSDENNGTSKVIMNDAPKGKVRGTVETVSVDRDEL